MSKGKLVRDKIPAMIRGQGRTPSYCILDDAQYEEELARKLDEEVLEFHTDKNLEELADILSYCILMADVCGLDLDEIMNEKVAKNEAKYPVEKARGNATKYTELK